MKFLYYLLFIVFFPLGCFAQFTISGRILNQADTKPVANVNVFLSNATIGGKTAADGTFKLHNVKPGKYELVVSIIGFETNTATVTIENNDIKLPDNIIFPKTTALNEVKIKPADDPDWDRNYGWFKDEFLGTSDLSSDCRILNPELLDLHYDEARGILKASSVDFLNVENRALGYKVKYLLTDFTLNNNDFTLTIHKKQLKKVAFSGFVLFEELKGTPSEEQKWKKRRQQVYENSSLHFLRAALNNNLEEEGFQVQQLAIYANPQRPSDSLINARIKKFTELRSTDKKWDDSLSFWVKKTKLKRIFQTLMLFPLNGNEIVSRGTDKQGQYAFGCDNDALYVTYNKNHHFHLSEQMVNLYDEFNTENTLINFVRPFVYFDNNGWINDPDGIIFNGVWGRNRVAGFLPLDYDNGESKITSSDTTLTGIEAGLQTFSAAHITEKVYLHLDKPAYMPGDTLRYKAYVVAGAQHLLSELSGVLHVELMDPKDSVIKRQTLQLASGISWGDIALSDKLPPGNYHIRAYSNWMRNAGAEYFYDQKINLGILPPLISSGQSNQHKPDVQFFPEGGQLVNGTRSRVAFKAVNENGLGEAISGTIDDNNGNAVADLNTMHLGMGVFALTPQSGKTYKARINRAGEAPFTVDLPQALEEGFTLGINNSQKDSIYIKVAANEKTVNELKNHAFYLVAQSGGKIYYTSQGKLEGAVYIAKVEKSRFPSGIVQFTLFSAKGEPQAERIAFLVNPDTLKLKMDSLSLTYTARQKVTTSLYVKDNENKPVTGSFSIAVINESKVVTNEAEEGTILNNLLLKSDLKGYIENPGYYFLNANDQTNADLDVLMLTQGYRRFEWKQVLNHTVAPIKWQPEKSLELTGTVKTPSGKPVPNGKVILAVPNENLFKDTLTDANGNFKFSNLNFSDTSKLMLRARKENDGSNITISVKEPDYPPVSKQKTENQIAGLSAEKIALMQKNYNDYQKQRQADSLKGAINLKQVTINAKKENKAPDMSNSANLHGGGNADQVIMGDKLNGCVNLSDCLIGKIMGVDIKNGVAYVHRSMARFNTSPMVVIIDGLVFTGSHLNDLDANDVYSIEVLRTSAAASIYGSNASGGALIITTKRGTQGSNVTGETAAGIITYPYSGYYKARAFYSPKYNNPQTGIQPVNPRNTVYWNPDIITDKNGKASFEYYNTDAKGIYRVVIEGIDNNGNLGRQVYHYKVE